MLYFRHLVVKVTPAYSKIRQVFVINQQTFVNVFQIFLTPIQKASIRLSGKNNASTELRWPSSVTKTKTSEKLPRRFVPKFPIFSVPY